MLGKHRLVCHVEKRGGEYKESARGREDLQHTERRPATHKQLSVLLLVFVLISIPNDTDKGSFLIICFCSYDESFMTWTTVKT